MPRRAEATRRRIEKMRHFRMQSRVDFLQCRIEFQGAATDGAVAASVETMRRHKNRRRVISIQCDIACADATS
jgi:hypothetical protein